ncbi:MAG: tryptophan--tRNA ligase [Bacilli bacterium]|nr:tryptophan--tRNA ligase [Bacilli bacterium]
MKKTILTGIRPTGNLHLGHYFGAGQNWIKLQNEDYDFYLEIADIQALTDNFDNPAKVRHNVREIVMDMVAMGVDPNKLHLFVQSMVPEIAELTVIYSNLVTMARLYRNPTVKTEIAQKKALFGNSGESVTYGFVGYPVSQAADITAFEGQLIPVGEDQLPLIEQCREIVHKFNTIYGQTLVMPEPLLSETPRIKGLDGAEKMGKSLGNGIFLVDSEETVKEKIMSAVTDPDKIHKDDPANPEKCMVYYYHKLIKNKNINTVCEECKAGKRGCVACKKELIEKMIEFLKPIQEKRKELEENPQIVDDILIQGTEKSIKKAKETMKKVRKSIKIDYFNEE